MTDALPLGAKNIAGSGASLWSVPKTIMNMEEEQKDDTNTEFPQLWLSYFSGLENIHRTWESLNPSVSTWLLI